jgi:23S rRNA (adenine2503-C2)-methyltransferase
MSMDPIALQALTPQQLHERVAGVSLAQARKAVAAVHRHEDVVPHSALSRAAADAIVAAGHVPTLRVEQELRSQEDPFVKYVFRTADDHLVETVRIPLERTGRFSVCVSSQVGCALGCRFCATGRLGLIRNLQAWELVEQVRVVKRQLQQEQPSARVHGVVFQGMGEPMSNMDRVLDAIAVMTEPAAMAIDARNITVSTSGLPVGIRRLAREAPKVRLALSIHAARPQTRTSLMPIAHVHPLEALMDACVDHAVTTGLQPLWAVTLLAGHNDSDQDADELATLALEFARRSNKFPRVSIIPYNRIEVDGQDPYVRVALDRESRFRDVLSARGVFTHKRYSGGHDVAAACGQLAARASESPTKDIHAPPS